MASPVRMKLTGAKELDKALGELGVEVAEKIGVAAVRATSRELQDQAIDDAPVGPGRPKSYKSKSGAVRRTDYGHLRDNIKVRRVKARKAYVIAFVVTMGQAFWSVFLELGTVKMRPHPWARPLFQRMQTKLNDVLLTNLRQRTDRAIRRLARKANRKG